MRSKTETTEENRKSDVAGARTEVTIVGYSRRKFIAIIFKSAFLKAEYIYPGK